MTAEPNPQPVDQSEFFGEVVDLLGDLYSSLQISALASRSGINASWVDTTGGPRDAASSLIDQAWKRSKLVVLFRNVQRDYGDDTSDVASVIADLAGQAAKIPPPHSVRNYHSRVQSRLTGRTSRDSQQLIDQVVPPASEEEEGEWVGGAENRLQSIRESLDVLQVQLDVLRTAHSTYSIAIDLARQSRRLEQVTDVPEGTGVISVRIYRDTLDAVIDALGGLEMVDVAQLIRRVAPPLVAEAISTRYQDNLQTARQCVDRLTGAETNPTIANDLAGQLAYRSKELPLTWEGALYQLFLRFDEQLQSMRAVLPALTL